MATGERAEKFGHGSREYWSRRGRRWGMTWGRISKWITHRMERARNKRIAREEFAALEVEDV